MIMDGEIKFEIRSHGEFLGIFVFIFVFVIIIL